MTKRMKADEPSAIALLAPARSTREKVAADGGDFAPMVLFQPRRGQGYVAVLDGGEAIENMLGATLMEMRRELGPPMWIAVTTDAYVREMKSPDDIPTRRLAEAFADGDPSIIEQMVVVLKHRHKGLEVAVQTYRHTPADGWEWDEPEVIDEAHSNIGAVLTYFM